jgi:trans-2,3-dihydro-3-hydroxyanthranilate isomerase
MTQTDIGRRYATVDVFTREAFGGNPLAVVVDADGLDAATMQAIAREFGYSETTFVLPPADPANTARVRIFTPKAELPFAGHPNVGTAYVLAARGEAFGSALGERLRFEEDAGLVAVDLLREDGVLIGARLTAPRQPALAAEIPADVVAACAGLPAAAIATGRHPPRVASCGLAFAVAELVDPEALARAAPSVEAFARLLPFETRELLLYVDDAAADTDVAMRMFAPLLGVPEDPATGSAAAALVGMRALLAPEPDLALTLRIAQGAEVGRPSLLLAEADKRGGAVEAVRVGGRLRADHGRPAAVRRVTAGRHFRPPTGSAAAPSPSPLPRPTACRSSCCTTTCR